MYVDSEKSLAKGSVLERIDKGQEVAFKFHPCDDRIAPRNLEEFGRTMKAHVGLLTTVPLEQIKCGKTQISFLNDPCYPFF